MAFNPTATLDYYYHFHSQDTPVDKGWHLDISGELVSPAGERYPIAESVIHSQADEVAVMMPSTPPRSDCGQSDDIMPGTERPLPLLLPLAPPPPPPQQQQRRKRSRQHRGRKGQQQQNPDTTMAVQKREDVNGRFQSFSLSGRKSPSMTSSNNNGGGGVQMAVVAVCGDHRRHSESCESHEDPLPTTTEKKQRLYKTELCRNWQELDHCRYGDKCQYAHGLEDLRNVERHPKYKTQVCRTYYQTGSCPYGTRCTFRHLNEGSPRLPAPTSTSTSSSSSVSRTCSITQPTVKPRLAFDNPMLLPTDAESLLPPGLLVDLDEPPPSFYIPPYSSILLPCSPSNHPLLGDTINGGMWKQPSRAATL